MSRSSHYLRYGYRVFGVRTPSVGLTLVPGQWDLSRHDLVHLLTGRVPPPTPQPRRVFVQLVVDLVQEDQLTPLSQ